MTTPVINRDAPAAEIVTRRAPLAAADTWNADARTLEVVFSTGAAVDRYDAYGVYSETLALNQDWTPFVGAPVLNNHRRDDLNGVLGSVLRAWTVSGSDARALIRLSRRADVEPIIQDVLDGHIRNVSVAYTVQEWKETRDTKSGARTKVATKWTPVELSIVTVPADRQATIRKDETMTVTPSPAPAPGTTPAVVPVTLPAPAPANDPAIVDRSAVNAEIRSIAQLSGLDQTWIDGMIDRNGTADAARSAAFEAMRTRSESAGQVRNTTIQVGQDHTDPEIRVRTIGEALYARVTPGHQLAEPSRPYAHMTTLDIARDCLRVRSMPVTGLAPATIIERALHSTSDFPLILGDAIGRTLRQAYAAAPSGLKRVARPTTARDFRDEHRIQLSEAPKLEKVNEKGEFRSGTLAEGKETYRLVTYGRIIGMTRQAIVNDDLGAFTDLARRFGQAGAATEAQTIVDLLEANAGLGPTMTDTKALFHTDHKNKSATGAAPSVTTLSAGRAAMRKQVGLSGELIAVTPKYLITPAELETASEQLLTSLQPAKAEDVNPFSTTLSLVVEPRFASATRWYLSADSAEIDGLEYAYLEGQEGVQIETKAGFEVDGVQIKARLDFGAGFVDWRSWFTNAGA